MTETIGLLEEISSRKLDLVVKEGAAGDVRRTAADVSRIRDDLGWSPATSLEDGLRAQWEWAAARVPA